MRPILILALVGCAAPARIGYTSHGGDDIVLVPTEPHVLVPEGTCAATFRVHVVDATQRSVSGAEVTVTRSIHMNAPSMVPFDRTYRSVPVFTDADGEAMTCAPDQFPDKNEDMFTRTSGGAIEVQKRGRTTTVTPPFGNPIVLR